MPTRVGVGGWVEGLEGCANWDGGRMGGWHGLFLFHPEVVLQLVQPEHQLLKGGPLAVVGAHATVCQLLQNKKLLAKNMAACCLTTSYTEKQVF